MTATGAALVVRPGDVLDGRYEVLRLAGTGARKQVHVALDLRLGREVAVCSLQPGSDAEEGVRLRREAALLARLGDHPSVVAVHDLLETGGGPVMVCRYLAGGSLQQRLHGVGLPLDEVSSIVRDVATALSRTHLAAVVHRDVKPANIWLDESGGAVLGDFGLATAADCGDAPHDELLVGTPSYVAPEQLVHGRWDARSDLYSLGAVLFELLVGRPPFADTTVLGTVARVLQEQAPAPSSLRAGLPPGMDELVLSLLSKEPQQRLGSAEEVLAQLVRTSRPRPAAVQRAGTRNGFVGRGAELEQLHDALDAAASGRGGLTLVLGAPGIGKTRTVLELAHQAAAQGWTVLTGRCHQNDSVPVFWPWTQVVRAAQQALPQPAAGPLVPRPALSALLPGLDAGTLASDSAASQSVLFRAVHDLLSELAGSGPVVVLLDDAHWMDAASRGLTAHLARAVGPAPVALVVCARDGALSDDDDASAAGVDQLAGAAGRTVRLGGLTRSETRDLAEVALHVTPDRWLLDELFTRSDGNPFHVNELVRLLRSEHRVTAAGGLLPGETVVHAGVHDVLRRRLRHVSDECAELLHVMSVAGREATVPMLCAMTGHPAEQVLLLVDEAVRAHLVVQTAARGLRFTHALVQEALYEEVPTCRRPALHRRVMSALIELHGRECESWATELAHHAVRAQVDGDVVPSIVWSWRAGRAAAAAGAHEDAVLHYGRSVELAATLVGASADVPTFGDLLLDLGDAQRRLGQSEQARLTFFRAAGRAMTDEDPELLARAALGYGLGLGGFGFVAHVDGVLLSLLEEAAAALDEGDSLLRLKVLARLAIELHFTPFHRRRRVLVDQARQMARRLGDPLAEALALYCATMAELGPDDLEQRRRSADRVIRLAAVVDDVDLAFRGHQLRLAVALEQGDDEQARLEVQACGAIADLHREPSHAWLTSVFQAMLALAAGQHDEALRLSNAALQLGCLGSSEMAQVVHGTQLLVVHWARGRVEEVLDVVRVFADLFPHAPAWRCALAFCCTELGRTDEARAHLDGLAARDFADVPQDGNRLTALSLLAVAAARLGDADRAARLATLLEPYADRRVVLSAAAVSFVSVRLPLGLARAACGRTDQALHDLAMAHASHVRTGNPALTVWSGEEYVRLLLERADPSSQACAEAVLAEVLPLARELGMNSHIRRLESLAAGAGLETAAVAVTDAVSILISDVAGSTALTEALGERAVHVMLAEHRRLLEHSASRLGGVLLKVLGDAVVLAFPSTQAALRCAADAQRHYEQVDHSPVRVRIGVHTGPVLKQGDSMYGRTMIVAFRVADQARAGEVLVSAQARRDAGSTLAFDEPRVLSLKGIAGPQEVHRLSWQARVPEQSVALPALHTARRA